MCTKNQYDGMLTQQACSRVHLRVRLNVPGLRCAQFGAQTRNQRSQVFLARAICRGHARMFLCRCGPQACCRVTRCRRRRRCYCRMLRALLLQWKCPRSVLPRERLKLHSSCRMCLLCPWVLDGAGCGERSIRLRRCILGLWTSGDYS